MNSIGELMDDLWIEIKFLNWYEKGRTAVDQLEAKKIWEAAWEAGWNGALDAVRHEPLPSNPLVFYLGEKERLRIDGEGVTYYGERIEDAGEAHRLLLEHFHWMNKVREYGEVRY